jgi:tRNA A37 threonylcarbamoyladenosine dehydratase
VIDVPSKFSRSEMLFKKEGMTKLENASVIVFGIGGVGSYVVEALSRSKVGHIDLVDNDVISVSNINRQLIALNSSVGKDKVEVAKERILDINENCKVNTYKTFFLPENSNEFDFTKYDYVIDCIDTISGKIELVVKANNEGCKIISCMGTGNKVNPCMFEVSDIYKTSVCPLAKVMRKELKNRGIKKLKVVYSKEEPMKVINVSGDGRKAIPGSNAFTPSVAGLIIASEVIKDLLEM